MAWHCAEQCVKQFTYIDSFNFYTYWLKLKGLNNLLKVMQCKWQSTAMNPGRLIKEATFLTTMLGNENNDENLLVLCNTSRSTFAYSMSQSRCYWPWWLGWSGQGLSSLDAQYFDVGLHCSLMPSGQHYSYLCSFKSCLWACHTLQGRAQTFFTVIFPAMSHSMSFTW